MGMITNKLLILSVLTMTAFSAIKELGKQQFTSIFGRDLQHFSSDFSVSKDYFILFYRPEIENSLEAREMFHQVAAEHERRSIDALKRKGVTQFEDFQMHLQKSLQLVQIDCGQNQEVCSFFQVGNFPGFLLITKQNKVYLYQAHVNPQQIYSFITMVQDQRIVQRYLRPHQIKENNLLGKIQSLLGNEFMVYLIVFLLAPFLFGYFVMAKPGKQGPASDPVDQGKKNTGKIKQMKRD